MENTIAINGTELPVREFNGQRVVTFEDVTRVHGQSITTIRDNFNRNKKYFVHSIDYYKVKGMQLKSLHASKYASHINVFTESGYLMLVKSLTGDVAWQVQRELVRRYFATAEDPSVVGPGKEQPLPASPCQGSGIGAVETILERPYRVLLYYRRHKRLTQREAALILGVSRGTVQEMERRLRDAGILIEAVESSADANRRKLLAPPRLALPGV